MVGADADITATYEEINARCNGDFERTDLYTDIIQRQIEKMFISSSIDEENNGVRQDYRLFSNVDKDFVGVRENYW